eukprot:670969-Hanusia_phi.AAC.2
MPTMTQDHRIWATTSKCMDILGFIAKMGEGTTFPNVVKVYYESCCHRCECQKEPERLKECLRSRISSRISTQYREERNPGV